ncbi:MAG: glutamine-hydrolyzing carbamoyl-phosphate synthase small subunit [Chitinophagales bacterium]|jgi:carbamoyl-phosphate synthase small subunit|nr:glutamine-hydrolyzing carbamoyl-phosphate synthase small subunit [Chitinophagales bacterium]
MNKQFVPSPAVLLLADGTVFYGKSVGKTGISVGEICFNTGMTGYQEIFTDPSYFGQTIIMTSDHIGNYGVKTDEVESNSVKISGLICKKYAGNNFSRLSGESSLQQYFEKNNLVGISDVDTRALTIHVRQQGAMNCVISSETTNLEELKKILAQAPNMDGLDLAIKVTTDEPYFYGDEKSPLKVAVLDCGIKENILKCLTEKGIYAKVFNAKTSFSEMEAFNPNGYFISNGPGDPASMAYAVKTVKEICDAGKPIFGICLGHQLLALANGISTHKMHHGHRGINHPVKNLLTGLSEITSQNHGFEVSRADIEKSSNVEITHVNLNDNTVEGIRIKGKKAFSVQYHPESSPGPHDSRYLFEQFVANMIA